MITGPLSPFRGGHRISASRPAENTAPAWGPGRRARS